MYTKIALAVHLAHDNEKLLQRAAEMARWSSAQIYLIHVIEYLPPLEIGYDILLPSDLAIESALESYANESLAKMASCLNGRVAAQRVAWGSPKVEICRFAEDNAIDLILLSSRGSSLFGIALGSTAAGVLLAAPCDVLAVHLSEEDERKVEPGR